MKKKKKKTAIIRPGTTSIGVKGGGIATNSLLKVNGETAYSSMPYWGGGYNNFGNNDGMRFNGTISDYTVTVDKNKSTGSVQSNHRHETRVSNSDGNFLQP